MAEDLDFLNGYQRIVGQHRVYLKSNWLAPWVQIPWLHCVEATWSTAPSLPTATLIWHYGNMKQPAWLNFLPVLKLDVARQWIRIDSDTDAANAGNPDRRWYGVIEDIGDQLGGIDTEGVATGVQELRAYGLEKLLADHIVRKSIVKPGAGGDVFEVKRALTFNRRLPHYTEDDGNRSEERNAGGSYVFSDQDPDQPWTSRNIIEYLLEHHVPGDFFGSQAVPFSLNAPEGIPIDWDAPVLTAENASTYQLIAQLIDRRRLMSWRVVVDENQGAAQVVVESMAEEAISVGVPGADPIPAAARQVNYLVDLDPLTDVALDSGNTQVFDQVVARGPRMRSVGTFSFEDGTLDTHWEYADELDYKNGASNEAGYGALGTKEQQERNAEVRAEERLEKVFARFRIPTDWDFKVKDGENGGGAAKPMFLTENEPLGSQLAKQFYPTLFIEQTMPLVDSVDYSGDKIFEGTLDFINSAGSERPPLVAFLKPHTSGETVPRWIRAEELGAASELEIVEDDENHRYAVTVSIPFESHAIECRVHGGPQHAIAATDFAGLAADPVAGAFDYKGGGMIVTFSLKHDAYFERFSPAAPAGEAIRVKVIDAGEEFRRDYVAPNTVVDIDDDGSLKRSDGGWLPREVAGDVGDRLQAVADIAAQWYTREHQVLTLETKRMIPATALDLADLVIWLGNEGSPHRKKIASPISEIRITWPFGVPGAQADPIMQVVTWAGELDAVGVNPLVAPPPEVIEPVGVGRLEEIGRREVDPREYLP